MVALLGSGVVLVRGGGAEVEAQGNPCEAVRPFKGTPTGTGGGPTRSIVAADPCCTDGMAAFFTGYNNMKSSQKAHLKDFAAVLTESKSELLEYCVMVWGLTKADSVQLAAQMKERYQLKEYKKATPAKK
jgi:hypothetical protein